MAWRIVDLMYGAAMASVVAWTPIPSAKVSFSGHASGMSLVSFTGKCDVPCGEGEYVIAKDSCSGHIRVDLWALTTGAVGRDADMQKVLAGSDRWLNRYAYLQFRAQNGQFQGDMAMNGQKVNISGNHVNPCALSWEMDITKWGLQPPVKDFGIGKLSMDSKVKVQASVGW